MGLAQKTNSNRGKAYAREFRRWFNQSHTAWPLELELLGSAALMSFDFLDQPAKNRTDRTNDMARADLIAFASAYEAWIASR